MEHALNWMWQGALLAVVATGHARLSRRLRATVRYRLWWVTLLGVLALPVVSMVLRDASPGPGTAGVVPGPVFEVPWSVTLATPVLAAFWASWTALSLVRLAAALILLRRIKSACSPFPIAREARLFHSRAVTGVGRRATLAVSPAVGSAAVLGGREPVIAVSPALLRRLTDGELDQIVLHEWAHVQRRDDLAQLTQQIVMAIFGLHPAVWWCTRQLQLERELACDQRVVEATGSAKAYAACLVKLAEGRTARDPVVAPAAIARAQLATRIARVLQTHTDGGVQRSTIASAAGALMVLVTVGLSARVPLVRALALQLEAPHSPYAAWADTAAPDTVTRIVHASSILNAERATASRQAAPPAPRSVDARPSGQLPTPAEVMTLPALIRGGTAPAVLLPVEYAGAPVPLSRLPGEPMGILAPSLRPDRPPVTPWTAAADAGVAIGRGSAKAGRATAGFFTRMSKSIAGRM